MARTTPVNVGTAPNDDTGDTLRAAFILVNQLIADTLSQSDTTLQQMASSVNYAAGKGISYGGGTVILQKKLSGTTSATEGGSATVAHGLSPSKIIAVSTLVQYTTDTFISEEYGNIPDLKFSITMTATDFILINRTADSALMLSKPFTAIVTYEA